ncbi:hypothetical protein EXIGLDRAFT_406586 [Exidia glandulosa HHB12029]|uniref:Uncharacterized protein n=1 Tax=Exidia glandulosa HHB12029 TaxID=1314781 RepID=A0A165BIK5_EXIGL|nr:hypothetical protein EXIGLDRAFT_406586 [Exidia glandulosa HHB12029]
MSQVSNASRCASSSGSSSARQHRGSSASLATDRMLDIRPDKLFPIFDDCTTRWCICRSGGASITSWATSFTCRGSAAQYRGRRARIKRTLSRRTASFYHAHHNVRHPGQPGGVNALHISGWAISDNVRLAFGRPSRFLDIHRLRSHAPGSSSLSRACTV